MEQIDQTPESNGDCTSINSVMIQIFVCIYIYIYMIMNGNKCQLSLNLPLQLINYSRLEMKFIARSNQYL